MKIRLKITRSLDAQIRADLARPHEFASERVGFLRCQAGALRDGIILLACDYSPVLDDEYVDDRSVGARIGEAAIRHALESTYASPSATFHVHLHAHRGRPWFSRTDLRELPPVACDFFKVAPQYPHGMLLLSSDDAAGLCWSSASATPHRLHDVTIVGASLTFTDRAL